MVINKISRKLFTVVLMLIMMAILLFYVDLTEKVSGLNKELGNKDLADFNWTYAR